MQDLLGLETGQSSDCGGILLCAASGTVPSNSRRRSGLPVEPLQHDHVLSRSQWHSWMDMAATAVVAPASKGTGVHHQGMACQLPLDAC